MGTAQSVGRRDSDADVGAGGEDLISALADDMLVHILLKLRDAAAAARTSVLARRWRGLWALLPQLTFADGIEHHRIVHALAAHQVRDLRGLRVATRQASVEYLAVWLPIVARRLTGSMLLRVVWHEDDADAEEDAELEPEQRGAILLPCFQRATTVTLEFSFLRLVLPPSGVFARLKVLKLVGIHLYGQCSLGDALSSPRCPSLQILSVTNARGLGNFTIHSKSLLELELTKLPDMQQLIVRAPSLRMLNIIWCFTDALPLNPSQPVANISAPRLELLWWMCDFVPSSLQLGEMAHLRCLVTGIFSVYGPNSSVAHNHCCMSILQHIERLSVLSLYIIYPPVIGNMEYLMEDMTSLPDVTILTLDVTAYVHSFGASVFHVLRMCPRLKALSIRFPSKSSQLEAQTAFCPSGCICDQPPNWKTEEVLLDRLQQVEILGFTGTEHEVALLKRLFSWATVLKRMMIKFHGSVTESKRNRLCQLLLSFSRPEICLHAAPLGKKYARIKACSAPSWRRFYVF